VVGGRTLTGGLHYNRQIARRFAAGRNAMSKARLVAPVAVTVLALAAAFAGAGEPAHPAGDGHVVATPASIVWNDAPSLPGAKVAALKGDPTKEGAFVIRLKLPDGYTIKPHWHPMTESLTILQGNFLLGKGTAMDKAAATALPAGSFSAMPARMVHHAWADGETVVQLHGMGPWQLYYVDPKDGPTAPKWN
jgi:hypothetical protein